MLAELAELEGALIDPEGKSLAQASTSTH